MLKLSVSPDASDKAQSFLAFLLSSSLILKPNSTSDTVLFPAFWGIECFYDYEFSAPNVFRVYWTLVLVTCIIVDLDRLISHTLLK